MPLYELALLLHQPEYLMNKLIVTATFLMSLAFATVAEAGAFRIPPNQDTASVSYSVATDTGGVDPETMVFTESRKGSEVTSRIFKHGNNTFYLFRIPKNIQLEQLFNCFSSLKLDDTKRGAILIETTDGQKGFIEFYGAKSTSDPKMKRLTC